MKPSLTVLVLVLLLLNILAGSASGPNQSRGMATDHDVAVFCVPVRYYSTGNYGDGSGRTPAADLYPTGYEPRYVNRWP
jgi:hypothetical protein